MVQREKKSTQSDYYFTYLPVIFPANADIVKSNTNALRQLFHRVLLGADPDTAVRVTTTGFVGKSHGLLILRDWMSQSSSEAECVSL